MDELWVEGYISTTAVLQSPYRSVTAVFLHRSPGKRHWRRFKKLEDTAVSYGIPVHRVDEAFFEKEAGGQSHGGVMARVGARQFISLADVVAGEKRPFVVMIDGVEDPYNFGQAVRSLYAAGVSGLVLRPRNWTTATDVVARASAGASEQMPIAIAETAEEAALFYRAQGLTIACTAQSDSVSLYEADLTLPLFVLIGGEKRGVTRSFREQADLLINIPYKRPFAYSLGTTASAAILGFERMRQLDAKL